PSPPARPSKEDLAALDALLNPSASGTMRPQVERPRAERWEPQFRPQAMTPRPMPRQRSPVLALSLASVVIVGAAAAWYYFQILPARAAGTTARATPRPSVAAPPTTLAAPPPTTADAGS